MAKDIKDIYVGARMDKPQVKRIKLYIAALGNMTIGEFLRRSVDEYMKNHPVKKALQEDVNLPNSVKQLSGKE